MIAIKYRDDLQFQWPQSVKNGVTKLPEGYDKLITQEVYNQLIIDNTASFEAHKIASKPKKDLDTIIEDVAKIIKKYDDKIKLKDKDMDYSSLKSELPDIPSSISGQDKTDLIAEIDAYLISE